MRLTFCNESVLGLTYIGLASTKGKWVELRKERERSELARKRFAEPASNLNLNKFYSISKLKHMSIQKHNGQHECNDQFYKA
jgi:hypothetical protein